MLVIRFLFVLTAGWHLMAAYFFLVKPEQTLRSFTNERPVSPITCDMMRFLGALNGGYFVLAGWGTTLPASLTGLCLVLSVANGSQFALDLHAHRTERWKRKLLWITRTDGFFMLAHALAFVQLTW